MWTEEVLRLVAGRSAPGARAASFTVAGAVRRRLADAGFAVEKRPGFGRKRERLEARWPGEASKAAAPRTIAVIGGGIAGACAARAVRALGLEPLLIEASALGAGASGNPAALVTPRLDAGLGPPADLFASAFRRAVQLYEREPRAVIARGVRQLAREPRDAGRFAKIAASDLFEPGALATDETGLDQRTALVVEPAPILADWAGAPTLARVTRLRREIGAWVLLDANGGEIARAEAVIVASGLDAARLVPDLPLQPVRGQASWAEGVSAPAAAWGGYVLPTRDGVLFGATHDRDDEGLDIREADHARNLATLAAALPELAHRVEGLPLAGRAAIRATTPDRLPYAGAIGEGLFVLAGFGSRGFSLAPLLAEHVAALALGAPSPLRTDLGNLVAPERIKRRSLKRGRS
jgi:tRNA 5-methylaminomethyl-2-thiouridine biosynthesis bifunctional protein